LKNVEIWHFPQPQENIIWFARRKTVGTHNFKEGIKIDPSRIEAILKINPPRNIKEVQSFIGQINFLRRFIPNLAELLKNITNMLKKDTEVKWNMEARQSFNKVKQALTQALC
jgi:hypothetical protein